MHCVRSLFEVATGSVIAVLSSWLAFGEQAASLRCCSPDASSCMTRVGQNHNIRKFTPYIWRFISQKYRMCTVYIYIIYMVLANLVHD